jgi:ATP/maltotriose-dependent transcriptional regulator MalT
VQTLLAAFPERAQGGGTPAESQPAPLHPASLVLHPSFEPLTEREMEVLRLLAAGQSNQEIAQQLVIAVGTVKRHINSILSKLGVPSRLQAVARARELGLL